MRIERLHGLVWGLALGGLVLYGVYRFRYAITQAAAGLPAAGPAHPLAEVAVTVAVIVGWSLIAVAVGRARLARRYPALTIVVVLAAAGNAILVALAFATVGAAFGAALPIFFVVSAAITLRLLTFGATTDDGVPEATPTRAAHSRYVAVVVLAVLAVMAAIVIRDAAYLALYRPPASGDELYFWWTATELLHRVGYEAYIVGFPVAGYLPGYPMVANTLIGLVPGPMFEAAGRALPFMSGMGAMAFLLRPAKGTGRLLGATTAVYLLVAFALFFDHEWVHALFFRLWYGEALAVIVFAALLIVLDSARQRSPWPTSAIVVACLGMGCLGVLTKQPLSLLLVPAVLPTIAIVGSATYRKRGWDRRFLLSVAVTAIGAVIASQMWGGQVDRYHLQVIYGAPFSGLLPFNPQGAVSHLVPYFFDGYKNVWVLFGLTTILALVADWRRFLPFWLAAAGMIASIFVLYLGPWSTVEYESGGRYILHGAYGWILFSLAALRPRIAETVETTVARLSDLAAPGGLRSAWRMLPGAGRVGDAG